MNKLQLYIISLIILLSISCSSKFTNTTNDKNDIDRKVEELLKKMTLKEKIGQMNQYNGFWDVTGPVPEGDDNAQEKYNNLENGMVGSMLNVNGVDNVRKVQTIAVEKSRLGIPLIIGFDVIHGYKTLSPIPLAEAASWDLAAIEKSAAVAASEAAASGINWTFAPMVDISRDPRWGRVMEGAGEDPYLGSKIGAARVKGFQGDDLSAVNTVAACTKHFAAYGFAEAGRDYNVADVSLQTLHNIILPPFIATVDVGVRTFMNSFNGLNGVPATGDKKLQRELLKKEWKFDGFVVSDWGSIGELVNHGFARDKKHAAQIAVNAGSDMDMETYAYMNHLQNLVNESKVDISVIDEAVSRILKVKFELGLFDDPYLYCDNEREKRVLGSKANMESVLDMAKKSIVLLKNDKNIKGQSLLPLAKKGLSIAIIGALADDKDSPLGSWRGKVEANSAVSFLEGMKNYPENIITYSRGADVTIGNPNFLNELDINETDDSGFPEALSVAQSADVVIVVLGENAFHSGEARSRSIIDLPGIQQELLEAVYEVNKNIVLVLNNGRPLTIPWAAEHIPTIVEAWQLGSQSGNAIAQVLYGDYNPSGKLPMTFPRSVGQIPIYYNHKETGRPNTFGPDTKIVFHSHYMDQKNSPLYVFGHGLSYASFEYKNLTLDKDIKYKGDVIKVSVDVTNTSDIDGEEVVQLYIRDKIGSLTRPVKELKGFEKMMIKAHETKTITFYLSDKELQFYTANNIWEVEPGDFELWIGGSSSATLNKSFKVKESVRSRSHGHNPPPRPRFPRK